jgi:hypothetical protein
MQGLFLITLSLLILIPSRFNMSLITAPVLYLCNVRSFTTYCSLGCALTSCTTSARINTLGSRFSNPGNYKFAFCDTSAYKLTGLTTVCPHGCTLPPNASINFSIPDWLPDGFSSLLLRKRPFPGMKYSPCAFSQVMHTLANLVERMTHHEIRRVA